MVVIAMLSNVHGRLTVNPEVTYTRGGQRLMSQMYGWNLDWAPGASEGRRTGRRGAARSSTGPSPMTADASSTKATTR